jgi:hypothetical protein
MKQIKYLSSLLSIGKHDLLNHETWDTQSESVRSMMMDGSASI